jgi:hypothetical protein
MPLKYIGMVLALVVLLNLCSLILSESGEFPSQVTQDLNTIAHYGIVQEEQTFGFLKYPMAPYHYSEAIYRVSTIVSDDNNEIFTGGWRYLWWFMVIPITGMIAFGMIITFFSLFRRPV